MSKDSPVTAHYPAQHDHQARAATAARARQPAHAELQKDPASDYIHWGRTQWSNTQITTCIAKHGGEGYLCRRYVCGVRAERCSSTPQSGASSPTHAKPQARGSRGARRRLLSTPPTKAEGTVRAGAGEKHAVAETCTVDEDTRVGASPATAAFIEANRADASSASPRKRLCVRQHLDSLATPLTAGPRRGSSDSQPDIGCRPDNAAKDCQSSGHQRCV